MNHSFCFENEVDDMLWLRMLYKQKIKIFVPVDDLMRPAADENGLIRYRYQNSADAREYTTTRAALTMIPGIEPVEENAAVTEVKPPRQRHKPVSTKPAVPAGEIIPPNTIVIYTDGGASPNPGPAGCGIMLMYGVHTLEIWEYLGKSTNNIAELTAILRALENVKNKDVPILLYSDSAYAIGVLTGDKKAKKNLELIEQVRAEMAKCRSLSLLKVKAHVGIAYNEHVDRLVSLARDTRESGSRRSASS